MYQAARMSQLRKSSQTARHPPPLADDRASYGEMASLTGCDPAEALSAKADESHSLRQTLHTEAKTLDFQPSTPF